MKLERKHLLFLAGAILLIVFIYLLPEKAPVSTTPESKSEESSSSENVSDSRLTAELKDAISKSSKEATEQNLLETASLFNRYFSDSQDSSSLFYAKNAISYYEKVIQLNPANLDAKAGLGWCTALSSPAPMKGIIMLRETAEANPEHELSQYYLGLLSVKSGQFEKAISRFEKVLQINSENFNVLLPLAESYAQTGKKNEAIKVLESLKSKNPGKELIQKSDELLRTLK